MAGLCLTRRTGEGLLIVHEETGQKLLIEIEIANPSKVRTHIQAAKTEFKVARTELVDPEELKDFRVSELWPSKYDERIAREGGNDGE